MSGGVIMEYIYLPTLPGLEIWLNDQPDPIAVLTEALIKIRQQKREHAINSHELTVKPGEDNRGSSDE